MKCDICGNEIETTFLGKLKGNHIKVNGKPHTVCNSCFSGKNVEDLKKELNK